MLVYCLLIFTGRLTHPLNPPNQPTHQNRKKAITEFYCAWLPSRQGFSQLQVKILVQAKKQTKNHRCGYEISHECDDLYPE